MTAKHARPASAWFDEASDAPIIAEKARQMESCLTARADGKVDQSELKAQEARLVELMKQIEPLLDEDLHAKVTELLCELTAYDLMQVLHTVHEARPKTAFRG